MIGKTEYKKTTFPDMKKSWESARYQQINKLYKSGVSVNELIARFGAVNTMHALGLNRMLR
jgi:serine/threonine-protein kinase RIO1